MPWSVLLLPSEAEVDDPASRGVEESLSRVELLERFEMQDARVTEQLRSRFPDWEVDYLNGIRGWTLYSSGPQSEAPLALIRTRIVGLPLEIAPDMQFSAFTSK